MIKKKKNKINGFTLIELLAVMAILAIIILVATPKVINIIEDSKKNMLLNNAYQLLKAGNLYYSNKNLIGEKTERIKFKFPNDISGLDISGSVPKNGGMIINEEGKIFLAIRNEKYCVMKDFEDVDITVSEDLLNCYVPYEEEILNGAYPVLKTGMIAVSIDADGTVRKADLSSEWYSYANKVWANAVTVTSTSREKYQNMKFGEEIKEEDILTYFVWIPRYKYKLWNVDRYDTKGVDTSVVHSIDIVFENKGIKKSKGSINGEYLTHPSFTFGEEINGYWVGKFESGYSDATTPAQGGQMSGTSSKIIIKPNLYAWRLLTVSKIYIVVQGMNDENNIFGLASDSDTHMMKNTEWGAVAYLSHSKYGKNSEVYINNNSSYTTGCGGDSANETKTETCKNSYGSKLDNVYNQSTTGNISGIFDMSGGLHEYVMGYTTKATTKYGSSGFNDSTYPSDKKYVDEYETTSISTYSGTILGDSTGEMGPFSNKCSWYEDAVSMIAGTTPWFFRGGNYEAGSGAGIFSFIRGTGAIAHAAFRVVLT